MVGGELRVRENRAGDEVEWSGWGVVRWGWLSEGVVGQEGQGQGRGETGGVHWFSVS